MEKGMALPARVACTFILNSPLSFTLSTNNHFR
jgi:hypothetical protein